MKRLTINFLLILLVLSGRADLAPLKSVAEAKRLTDNDCLTPRAFEFTGKVLSEDKRYWFFRDETGGVEIHNRRPESFNVFRGSIVRTRGNMTVEKNGVRKFLAETTDLLETGRQEAPAETTVTAILDGNMDYRLVRIGGVISAIVPDEVDDTVCWATLRTPTGSVYLTFYGKWNDANVLRPAIDAEVVVTGLAAPTTGLRRNLGHRVYVSDLDSVDVLRNPPDDPFAAPDLADANLPHRQKARGIVLAAEPRRFFLKTAAGRVIPTSFAADRTPAPAAGDLVSVVGFATDDPYRTQLTDALVRIDGRDPKPSELPKPYALKALFVNDKGVDRIESHVDGTFISVKGVVSTASRDELRISDGPYAISLDRDTLLHVGTPIPSNGSRIAIRGLCLVEFESPPAPTIYPTFKRFVLIPRNASDLVVLETPPWWTPFRLTLLVIALGTILLGSALWNVMLKRKSERRGKELYEEKIDHALAEQKVEERTRLAVELHDSVSQTLTGIALQLDGGETETAKTMLASCRGELRRCLWDLRSRTFEEKDMTEAVTRTIAPHLNGCAATVRFNVPRERLSESLTHAILRIVRELVVNAIRHGQAKHVKIAGEMHENTVSFSVTDDGCGFVPEAVPGPKQGHFGLLGIRERIEDFNGALNIVSVPDHGAKFTVTLTTTADETNEH